jgi:hypothetical protein
MCFLIQTRLSCPANPAIVMPARRAGIHGLLDHHGSSPKSWMLAFGKHDGGEVERVTTIVMPGEAPNRHARAPRGYPQLTGDPRSSPKPWMLAFGKHDG